MVVRFIRIHYVAPQGSCDSFMFVWFIRACPGRRRVHSGSFGCTNGVVEFIRVRLVHSGSPRRSSVHSGALQGSSGSLGRVSGVVGFIGFCLVHSRASQQSSCSFALDWFIFTRTGSRRIHFFGVHSGAPLVLSGSLGFVWFIWARSRIVEFFQLIHSVRPGGLRVLSRSFGSFGRAQAVVGFIRVRLDSFGRIPCDVGYIRVRFIDLVAPWGLSDSFSFVWFVRSRPR